MSRQVVKISLTPRAQWSRWVDRLRWRGAAELRPVTPANVDLTLVGRVAAEHVKRFVESIETYQLASRRTVQVLSNFEMPEHDGLQAKIPGWISERIRFGVVDSSGRDFRYATLRAMEMGWGDGPTELWLHLDEAVEPGTRAFIAAYLGDGADAHALRELPFSSLPLNR